MDQHYIGSVTATTDQEKGIITLESTKTKTLTTCQKTHHRNDNACLHCCLPAYKITRQIIRCQMSTNRHPSATAKNEYTASDEGGYNTNRTSCNLTKYEAVHQTDVSENYSPSEILKFNKVILNMIFVLHVNNISFYNTHFKIFYWTSCVIKR